MNTQLFIYVDKCRNRYSCVCMYMCVIYIHRAFCNHGCGPGKMESRLHYIILYKGLEHPGIFGMVVVGGGGGWVSWNQSPVGAEGRLYIYL